MRKSDREITDRKQIIDFLYSCDTVRIGFFDEEYPYVVPVSFGLDDNGETLTLYYHGAIVGKKNELARKNTNVCVEADCFNKYVRLHDGVTADYQSFIGFGKVYECLLEEKARGLELLMKHCGYDDYSADGCSIFEYTDVRKIVFESFSCKKRFK
ncbi:MAG: pyridoxamine 5'-phosphate oxidase family protein [Acutalibacteraceae bacterium]